MLAPKGQFSGLKMGLVLIILCLCIHLCPITLIFFYLFCLFQNSMKLCMNIQSSLVFCIIYSMINVLYQYENLKHFHYYLHIHKYIFIYIHVFVNTSITVTTISKQQNCCCTIIYRYMFELIFVQYIDYTIHRLYCIIQIDIYNRYI